MSYIKSCIRCWERLNDPEFFSSVAAMAGYSGGANPTADIEYRYHTDDERQKVASLLRRGLTGAECSRATGIKLGTIGKWRQQFVKEGKLQPQRQT